MKLTDAEREALDAMAGCGCCSSDYRAAELWPELAEGPERDRLGDVAVSDIVERIVAARLAEQREAIRVALVQQANAARDKHNQYADAGLSIAASVHGGQAETWEAGATLVREYQPEEDT